MKLGPRSFHSFRHVPRSRFGEVGFTLAELLVVVAIFIILTSVVLFGQSKFSSDSAIRNLAYQMALSVRQAQVYGLSVRGDSPGSTNFNSSFGLHFDTATPGSYIFFADTNLDQIYESGNDVKISTFSLANGDTLKEMYVNIAGNSRVQKDMIDITFKRPNPEALIHANGENSINSAEIIVQSALKDRTQTIWVTSTGQIYVTN